MKTRMGRPPRVELTPEIVSEIVNLIEQGTFPLNAARHVGIPKRTWYSWLAEGERGEGPTSVLLHAVSRSKGRLATKLYATMHSAAIGHEEPLRDAKGNVVFTTGPKGEPVPIMVWVPGHWPAAVRMLESLVPDEMLRQTGGSPVGGGGDDPDGSDATSFDIVYLTSNRDPKEMAEITRRIEERARRASTES